MSTYQQHLTLRVAWHDNCWNGRICNFPSNNSYCIALDRIREERIDSAEDSIAGKGFWELDPSQHPPCKAESGAFMNDTEWFRLLKHPYQENTKAKETHGSLLPTRIRVSPYSTFAVPFAWMLKSNQDQIEESLSVRLPRDMEAPFPTPWVFGRERQEALLNLFFDRLTGEHSLVFFYTKEGHPLGENIPRLIVGVGLINKVGKLLRYDSTKDKDTAYSPWDRIISHSIRPEGKAGFLLPYHTYLEPTGDLREDEHRLELLREIAVPADLAHIQDFSYAAELTSPDVCIATLVSLLSSIRIIKKHGIAKGPWDEREEWINEQIAIAWKDRGAFPGVGSVLEALGLRLGTSLFMDLLASKRISADDDPWPIVDAILKGNDEPPNKAYLADMEAMRPTWVNLSEERRKLLILLSRFDLTIQQAKRWFDSNKRNKATRYPISDSQIIENPYAIVETDLGAPDDSPVSMGTIDRGLLPESTIQANHPIPKPSYVGSPNDPRRVRAGLASVLQYAAEQGDSLLSQIEVISKLIEIPLSRELHITEDWIDTNREILDGVIEIVDVLADPAKDKHIQALQLKEFKDREDYLRKILAARGKKELSSLGVSWKELLITAITEAGGQVDLGNSRHSLALSEQADALEILATRKLSVLVGKAGTGKTSVVGALLRVPEIANTEGILLLAPTGKARVRLTKATQAEAYTVAQFLYMCKRYDGIRQRPLFSGGEPYRKQKNIIIDECSMLTMDDLTAILMALDLGHIKRIIMVGDPNQLPPIGVGRPFADLVGYLDVAKESNDVDERLLSKTLARLTIELRSREGAPSDSLRLASWFTREPQPVDGDRVLSELELGKEFNDLEICYWTTPYELHERMLEQFQKNLGLLDKFDIQGFNAAMGLNEKGWVPYESPNGAEKFQILSPVRMHQHGVYELNRWIQSHFRKAELEKSRQPWGASLGDEEIVVKDKVIQITNQTRDGWDNRKGEGSTTDYIANGEVGIVATQNKKFFNVVFCNRPFITFGYSGWKDFKGGSGPLELAYALTIHKSQGSEFSKVFVVIPRETRMLSRELLYTALTRARDKLILLVEGTDPTFLYEHSKAESSNTANRNTNLFTGAIREKTNETPYSDHLIHRTLKGHMVRSKSELVIANILYENKIEYYYERPLEGIIDKRKLRPDFTFIDPSGDVFIWEHLGMLNREDYRLGWDWKKEWYSKNGFTLGNNLFWTEDDALGGLDAIKVNDLAQKMKVLV